MSNRNAPIGVFDSGLGGLTVVKELIKCLPSEDIVYFGDTARVPYGTKSKEAIIAFSLENAQTLLKHKVKLIVVACNSSSSYAMPMLLEKCPVPVISVIGPGAQKAVESTENDRVGIIATSATVNSGKYVEAIHKRNKKVKAFQQSCPLFVPLVEEGWIDNSVTKDVVKLYLKGLMKEKIDTLILGCTHYPLLRKTIQNIVGKKVYLVDSAKEVAQEVKKQLKEKNILKDPKGKTKHTFLVSDRPQAFERIANKFLGKKIRIKLCGN